MSTFRQRTEEKFNLKINHTYLKWFDIYIDDTVNLQLIHIVEPEKLVRSIVQMFSSYTVKGSNFTVVIFFDARLQALLKPMLSSFVHSSWQTFSGSFVLEDEHSETCFKLFRLVQTVKSCCRMFLRLAAFSCSSQQNNSAQTMQPFHKRVLFVFKS